MKQYKALFLDMDGTFLDFAAAEQGAFFQTMEKAGYPATEELYRAYSAVNDSLWKAFERGEIQKTDIRSRRFSDLFKRYGISADGVLAEREYEGFLGEGCQLIPHAGQVLEYLAARYPLYVVTNGFAGVQRSRLKLAGIDKFMTRCFISEEIGFQKPQEEFFRVCFAHMEPGTEREEILLIGDSLTSDIQGAKNAGLDSCWFNPAGAANPKGIQPEFEIRSLTELMDLL